jgi:hypothetical protein
VFASASYFKAASDRAACLLAIYVGMPFFSVVVLHFQITPLVKIQLTVPVVICVLFLYLFKLANEPKPGIKYPHRRIKSTLPASIYLYFAKLVYHISSVLQIQLLQIIYLLLSEKYDEH